MHTGEPRQVSLSAVQESLELAVKGIQLLAAGLQTSQFDPEEMRFVPTYIVNLLGLVRSEIHRTHLAITQVETDPVAALFSHRTAAVEGAEGQDIILTEATPQERQKRLETLLAELQGQS